MEADTHALPAVLHTQNWPGDCAAQAQVVRAIWCFKKTILGGGREQVNDGLQANRERLLGRRAERQLHFTGDLATVWRRPERKILGDGEFCFRIGVAFAGHSKRDFTRQLGSGWRRMRDLIDAATKFLALVQFQSLVVAVRTRRIEKKQPKSVARPAIVAKKSLQAVLFHFGLLVSGRG